MIKEVEHGSLPHTSTDSRGDGRVAASSPIAAEPDSRFASRFRENSHKHRVALIDEFSLRRASTLNLLRAHIREGAWPFRDAAELLMQVPTNSDAPCSIVMSVGGRSVTEAPLREQLRCLRRALASTPVIVLSDRDESEEVVAVFREGARGYVPTSLEPQLVIRAIRMVLAGCAFVPAEVMMRSRRKVQLEILQRPCSVEHMPVEHQEQWPPRQLAVLHLLVQGRANKEIARALTMEESTVKVHVRHIMRKLGVMNRTQAALCARRLGIPAAPQAVLALTMREAHFALASAAPT